MMLAIQKPRDDLPGEPLVKVPLAAMDKIFCIYSKAVVLYSLENTSSHFLIPVK
jgi:hypothetical protein